MSRKGVTAEEKKSRMLDLFYETGECFQLKVSFTIWIQHIPKTAIDAGIGKVGT